jgi:hypothetical protein
MAQVDPTAATFIVDFPEFEDRDPALLTRLIVVAKHMVDSSWIDEDYTRAIELYVAHLLIQSDLAAATGGTGGSISSESLGPISVSYQKGATKDDPSGFQSTIYGAEFLLLARLNRGGPRSFG